MSAYSHTSVPVEWLPRLIGCRIYTKPHGAGQADWLRLVDVDLVDTGHPPGAHGYQRRAWVQHHGQVKPANLPNLASVKGAPEGECFERDGGLYWIPAIDDAPPLWELRPPEYTPSGSEPAISPAHDGALFAL